MARVLVIDDEEGIRTIVTKVLASAGHEVTEARDGAAAWAMLERQAVDLVVTDLYMPEMDGIELSQRLRQLPARPAVVAMSGGGFGRQVDVLEVAAHLGAAATLPKPFTREALLGAVARALSRQPVPETR